MWVAALLTWETHLHSLHFVLEGTVLDVHRAPASFVALALDRFETLKNQSSTLDSVKTCSATALAQLSFAMPVASGARSMKRPPMCNI